VVCYIRKYVIILGGGDIPVDVPQPKYWGDVSPASPAALTPVGAELGAARVENQVSGSGAGMAKYGGANTKRSGERGLSKKVCAMSGYFTAHMLSLL